MTSALARFRIRTRLIALALISVLGFSTLIAVDLFGQWNALNEARQRELRSLVESTVAIATQLDQQVAKGTISREEAQNRAKTQIGVMRYRGNEYFFITDMTPKMVMHPIRPDLDGKDLSANKDPNGKLLFMEFVQVVRASGSGYVDYLWPRAGSEKPIGKISYVQGYAPWGWLIGTGVYTDDLDALFWDLVKEKLLQVGLMMLAILALTAVLIRSITRPLGDLNVSMSRIANNELRVSVPGVSRQDEIGNMARAVEVLRENGIERERLEQQQGEQRKAVEARQAAIERLIQSFQSEAERSLGNGHPGKLATRADRPHANRRRQRDSEQGKFGSFGLRARLQQCGNRRRRQRGARSLHRRDRPADRPHFRKCRQCLARGRQHQWQGGRSGSCCPQYRRSGDADPADRLADQLAGA